MKSLTEAGIDELVAEIKARGQDVILVKRLEDGTLEKWLKWSEAALLLSQLAAAHR